MKQGAIIAACHALDKIMNQDLSLAMAKQVFDMREKLQPNWDFQVMQERKIAVKYPHVNPANASVSYDTGNSEMEKERLAELDSFLKELNDLADMDQDLSVEPIILRISEENIKIAGKDIKALQGFITFE